MIDFDDAQVVQRAQAGDRQAFGLLHDRYHQAIYTYFFYRVNDVSTAEDLTAEVFVKMVEKIDKYRPKGKPVLAWLYTIARNLLTDHYRKEARTPEMLALDERLVSRSDNPAQEAERGLDEACLRAALRHLTEKQRLVIIGKFIEKRSNIEMAEILKCKEGAIKSLQHRALAALRRAIEKEGCYEP